jgi:hypothetical protein
MCKRAPPVALANVILSGLAWPRPPFNLGADIGDILSDELRNDQCINLVI